MVALTVMGGVIGQSARVRRETMGELVSRQLFLLVQSGGGHVGCLAALLAPVRDYQRRLLVDAHIGVDGEDLREQEARIRAQRSQFLANDRFPDKSHLDYFNRQLRQINLRSRRLCYMEHPTPGTMMDLFTRSPDQSLFLTWTNPQSFIEHLSFWESAQGRAEFDLANHALRGEMYAQAAEDGGVILERPSLAGIAVCSRDCLMGVIAADNPLFQGSAPVFILDGDNHTGKAAFPAIPMESLHWWHRVVDRVLASRFDQEARMYSISAGAGEVLRAAEGREFLQLQTKYGFPPHAGAELCVRLMLLLHLCQDDPGQSIQEATALGAIKIATWLVTENSRVLNELKYEAAAGKRRADRALMLQKIRDKGPVSQRDLFRTYAVQNQTALGPALKDLLQSGEVAKDADGRLRVRENKEMTAKSSTVAATN